MIALALVALGIGGQDSDFPPLRETALESGVSVRSQGHRWRLEFRRWKAAAEANADPQRFLLATCDGRIVWQTWADVQEPKNLPGGVYFKVGRVDIASKYPVIAIRTSTGIGMHTATKFFRLVDTRIVYAGKPPAKNSHGPINYRGRQDEWLFDDYDWYEAARPNWTLRYALYRLDEKGRLRPVRVWKAPKGQGLRDTVRLTF